MKTLALGTKSALKIQATEKAVLDFFGGPLLKVVGVQAISGVPEQPVGMDETARGSMNRARGASKIVKYARFALGIESGLIDTTPMMNQEVKCSLDIAIITLIDMSNDKFVIANSVGIQCPQPFVAQSVMSRQKKTAGEFYAEANSCAPDDWHSHITQNKLSRSKILTEAILAAFDMMGIP